MSKNIFTFQKNVASAGTPERLTSQTVDPDQSVIIKAKSANTGTITVGKNSSDAAHSGTAHFKLEANEGLELKVHNTNQIWIDATVNGEGVEVAIG